MTFYFFDLETSGFSASKDRIMQFAGQRTDMDLKPIGEPDNILIKLTRDVLPSPEAVLVTGITPQKTITEGITEAEFCKYFMDVIAAPETIFVGFNNIRFDNDFLRFTLWRNFYDAYEWAWKNDCSTWDVLDLARMTRALRPDGINWPFASDGKPSNKLELLSSVNNLAHVDAHDALSDVKATIAVAKLIKDKQPKLFDYLLNIRNKTKVEALVSTGQPIIYTSGRYAADFEKTTVAAMVAKDNERGAALMYDLRVDPETYKDLGPADIAKLWQDRSDEAEYFPVKTLAFNKCPAIAPYKTLDKVSQERIKIHPELIDNHYKKLLKLEDFGDKLLEALAITRKQYQQEMIIDQYSADGSLYQGFLNDQDRTKCRVVRAADANKLADLSLDFADDRLKFLLPLYKARNYPKSLNAEEQQSWEEYRTFKISKEAEAYFAKISELLTSAGSDSESDYLLRELQLWGESVLPEN